MTRAAEVAQFFATHPVEFVRYVLRATPDEQQAAILQSVADNQMTSVRSGHGIGKSAVQAWSVIWFLSTRPYPKVPCTAPTQHQLHDILWAEISKWLRKNPKLGDGLIWTKEKVYKKGHPEEWFAVARTASSPDALQGFHADDVLYIIDEASGVSDSIFEPVLGALSTPGAKLLMCGNPTKLSGFFYDSHTEKRASYSTFQVDGRNSPRVSQEYIDRIIEMYGEDSNVFRVRVAGQFPKSEDDTMIPLELVEAAVGRKLDTLPAERVREAQIGCDVARFGDDETVIVTNVGGSISPLKHRHGQDLMKTVGDLVREYKALVAHYPKIRTVSIVVDDTGLGGGVTDRLNEVKREQGLSAMRVVPVNFAGAVPDKENAEEFKNISTYIWFRIRMLLRDGRLSLPADKTLISQLSTRKYTITSGGQIQIEAKEQMKKRGLKSPDRGDALALAVYAPKTFDLSGLAR